VDRILVDVSLRDFDVINGVTDDVSRSRTQHDDAVYTATGPNSTASVRREFVGKQVVQVVQQAVQLVDMLGCCGFVVGLQICMGQFKEYG